MRLQSSNWQNISEITKYLMLFIVATNKFYLNHLSKKLIGSIKISNLYIIIE